MIIYNENFFFPAKPKLGVGVNVNVLTMEAIRLKCEACKEAFLSQEAMLEHRATVRHKRNYYSHWFQNER